jgi:hypothetical protein
MDYIRSTQMDLRMSTIYVIKMLTDTIDKEILVTSNEGEATMTYWDIVKEKARRSGNETLYYLSFKIDKDGKRIEGTMEFIMINL